MRDETAAEATSSAHPEPAHPAPAMPAPAMPAPAMPAPAMPDPALQAAREAREAQAERRRAGSPALPASLVPDPLPYCIWATVALLAWLMTPPLAMAVFGTLGVLAYARAHRQGRRQTDCLLRSTRVAIGYLALVALAGAGVFGWQAWRLWTR
jgi:hypothetical protein